MLKYNYVHELDKAKAKLNIISFLLVANPSSTSIRNPK